MDGWMDMPSRGEPRWDASPDRAARIRYRGCRWAERRQLSAPVHPTPPWYSVGGTSQLAQMHPRHRSRSESLVARPVHT